MTAAPFCRDCLTFGAAGERAVPQTRCANCGSPRLLRHPERDALSLAHVDCDAFYASVEKRDDPTLRDRPLIVGGGRRGVVSTACYIARGYGVRSAMPMFKARQLCPQAVVVPPDMERYRAVARRIREAMEALTPLVEPVSIDEAFLDLSGADRLHGAPPAVTLARFARRVEAEIGVTVSVGLSYCKFLAKMASDMDKPRGFSIVGRAQAPELLAPMPVGRIHGVGKAAEARLQAAGLATIGDLRARGEIELMRVFGAEGRRLWRLSNGIDDRPVTPERAARSISAETTLDVDTGDLAVLEPLLFRLCEKLSSRLKAADLAAGAVTLKLKTSDFKTRTRNRSGLEPTQLAARLWPVARDLLRAEPSGARYRLIGIGAGDLRQGATADAPSLAEPDLARVKAREAAVDALRARFGARALSSGLALRGAGGGKKESREDSEEA